MKPAQTRAQQLADYLLGVGNATGAEYRSILGAILAAEKAARAEAREACARIAESRGDDGTAMIIRARGSK